MSYSPVVRIAPSKSLKDVEVLFGADAEGSEVTLDLKHGEVFLGTDDDWSD